MTILFCFICKKEGHIFFQDNGLKFSLCDEHHKEIAEAYIQRIGSKWITADPKSEFEDSFCRLFNSIEPTNNPMKLHIIIEKLHTVHHLEHDDINRRNEEMNKVVTKLDKKLHSALDTIEILERKIK